MNRLSARNQLIIAIAVLVVATVAVVLLAISPQLGKAKTIDQEIAAVRDDIAAQQAVVARRTSAKARAAANQVELLRIATRSPRDPSCRR